MLRSAAPSGAHAALHASKTSSVMSDAATLSPPPPSSPALGQPSQFQPRQRLSLVLNLICPCVRVQPSLSLPPTPFSRPPSQSITVPCRGPRQYFSPFSPFFSGSSSMCLLFIVLATSRKRKLVAQSACFFRLRGAAWSFRVSTWGTQGEGGWARSGAGAAGEEKSGKIRIQPLPRVAPRSSPS